MALIFDLETDGLLDEVTKIHCLVIKDTETGQIHRLWGDDIKGGVELLQVHPLIVGHNIIKYDIPVIRMFYPWFKPQGSIRDTIVCSHLMWPDLKARDFAYSKTNPDFPKQLIGRHSLKAWGYRLGKLKGTYGETADWKEFTPEMLAYCIQDVEVTACLWEKIQSKNWAEQSIRLEHDFAEIIFLQEQRGFAFDKAKAVKLYAKLSQRRQEITVELQRVIKGWDLDMKEPAYWTAMVGGLEFREVTKGEALAAAKSWAKTFGHKIKDILCVEGTVRKKHIDFNPGSRDHIARALKERHGWKPLKFGKDGKATMDEEILETLPYPEAKLLTEYLKTEKIIGMLSEGNQAWLKLEKNGRIHGEVNTNGAVTGRCTHNRPNVAQVPSVQKGKVDGVEMVLEGIEGGYGAECRELFFASPGYRLVGADLSGLELRCLSHYLSRLDGGAYAKEVVEGDIHETNRKAAGLETRAQAKRFIYAWLYGAGDWKIGATVGVTRQEVADAGVRGCPGRAYAIRSLTNFGIPLSNENVAMVLKGRELKKRFIEAVPAIGRLKSDITKAVQAKGHLLGLDGRRLEIRSAHAALNTLLQSAGAVIAKTATTLMTKTFHSKGWQFGREYALVANIHDEWQAEVAEGLEDDFGRIAVGAMQEAGRLLGVRCPITGEYRVGGNWRETH